MEGDQEHHEYCRHQHMLGISNRLFHPGELYIHTQATIQNVGRKSKPKYIQSNHGKRIFISQTAIFQKVRVHFFLVGYGKHFHVRSFSQEHCDLFVRGLGFSERLQITATGQKQKLQIMEMQVHLNTALISLRPLSGYYRSPEYFSSNPSEALRLLRAQSCFTSVAL